MNMIARFYFVFFIVIAMPVMAQDKSLKLASLGNVVPQSLYPDINLNSALRNLNHRLQIQPSDYEASLIKALVKFKTGDREAAIAIIERLIAKAPDFHLAYLIKGDLLLSRVRPVTSLGNNSILQKLLKEDNVPLLQNLRHEAQMRFNGVSHQPYQSKLPKQILALAGSVKNALLVDKSSHRLYIYSRNNTGNLILVRDYYVSTGKSEGDKQEKGDLKTPEGVYFVTSWIPKEKLPDKYGVGAFPVNYPNELDRRLGKTGHGIWLHGTESQFYSRPPLDSEGCVVLTNKDLQAIKSVITPGVTPVIITNKVNWVDNLAWQASRLEVLKALDAWRNDWQSMDVEKYLSHYADDFWAKGYDIKSWKSRKRVISKGKTFQQVRLTDISLLGYPQPGEEKRDEIIVARFKQQYQSNNFNSEMQKRLYLKRHAGDWKIVYEGR